MSGGRGRGRPGSNAAYQGREVTVLCLCLYDAARLDERVLADAHAGRPAIVPAGATGPRGSSAHAPGRSSPAATSR
ncbi:hypothetical protein ACIHCX_01090 [Streptomyces sp. NPDC052043]|uniref:hypothetical protein n=1 Tax=Streptomyces sp. NPDC052043 TaxID=3365684 RepID=UPI0037CDA656